MFEITTKELAVVATQRLLLKISRSTDGKIRERFYTGEIRDVAVQTIHGLLREKRLNAEVWLRTRSERLYLMHEKTSRIMTELQFDYENTEDGMVRRPRLVFVGRDGLEINETIGNLVQKANELGEYRRNNKAGVANGSRHC